jgi:hypothetical protein
LLLNFLLIFDFVNQRSTRDVFFAGVFGQVVLRKNCGWLAQSDQGGTGDGFVEVLADGFQRLDEDCENDAPQLA